MEWKEDSEDIETRSSSFSSSSERTCLSRSIYEYKLMQPLKIQTNLIQSEYWASVEAKGALVQAEVGQVQAVAEQAQAVAAEWPNFELTLFLIQVRVQPTHFFDPNDAKKHPVVLCTSRHFHPIKSDSQNWETWNLFYLKHGYGCLLLQYTLQSPQKQRQEWQFPEQWP